MKSTWCYILLFLLAYLPIHAQESEKRLLWEVELQGALTNCSSWEVEPAVTFFPFKYAGISMGLLFTAPYPSTSENGITADRQLQWSSTHSNAASYLLAWRPALRLNTPKLWLGHDKEYALFLSVSPGLTLPFPADRQFSIDYYPQPDRCMDCTETGAGQKQRSTKSLLPSAYSHLTGNRQQTNLFGRIYIFRLRYLRWKQKYYCRRNKARLASATEYARSISGYRNPVLRENFYLPSCFSRKI